MILGPPGTGKTTELIGHVSAEVDAGVSPLRIAFWTFTKAATKDACDRIATELGLDRDNFPWGRTIHSTAFKLLGLERGRMLNDEQWPVFAKKYSYKFSDVEFDPDEFENLPTQTPDDLLRFVHSWARNNRLDPITGLGKSKVEGVARTLYEQFVRRLDQFKREQGLLDFADLLEQVLSRSLRPPADVAFLDEAQDLSPLQIAVVEMWFERCERCYVAGDDDQAIYVFQGASPDWLRELATRCTPQILTRSRRVPVTVHQLAQRIIQQNKSRVPKAYEPATRLGRVLNLDLAAAMRMVDGTCPTFVLVRNRAFMPRFAAPLMERAVPFAVEGIGASSPLSNQRLRRAVNTAIKLIHEPDARVAAAELDALLAYVPSCGEFVRRGIKQRVKRAVAGEEWFDRSELCGALGLGTLIALIADEGPLSVLTKVSAKTRKYLEKLIERYGCLPEPQVILTTIHAAKGREKRLVIVCPDMSRATFKEYVDGGVAGREGENRVFYVAVTRTLDTLVLVDPSSRRHFDFPRLRFEEGFV